jgi:hypothetical protein
MTATIEASFGGTVSRLRCLGLAELKQAFRERQAAALKAIAHAPPLLRPLDHFRGWFCSLVSIALPSRYLPAGTSRVRT